MNSSESDEDIDDAWVLNLQELLDTLEPQIREAATQEKIEEFLLNLETTDSRFHRYSFIQIIKDKLESKLGPLIDNAVDKHDANTNDSTLVTHISGALLKSKEFHKVSKSMVESIQVAADNIEETVRSNKFDFFEPYTKYTNNEKNELFMNSPHSECSTIDGVDFMFLSPDRYKDLAKDIDLSKPVATRIHGLSVLQQVPQTDLVASEAWEATRSGLLAALDDEVEEINLKALQFISRLFLSGSSFVVREYFMLLVENLIDHFNDSTSHMVNIDAGLDLGDRRNILLLRKFYLLNKIQIDIPSYWLRYCEKYIDEMVESVTTLLEVNPQPISENFGERLLSPFHFISLTDPHALWLKKWTHGYYSRSKMLKYLNDRVSVLKSPIGCLYTFHKYVEDYGKHQHSKQNEDIDNYTSQEIFYSYFLHSLHFISHIILFKDGRKMLSLKLDDNIQTDADKIVLLLIKIVLASPTQFLNKTNSLFNPTLAILNIFDLFSRSGKNACSNLICSSVIVQELINSMRYLEVSDAPEHVMLQSIVFDFIAHICRHKKGRTLILNASGDAINKKNNPINSLCKLLVKKLDINVNQTNLLSLLVVFREIHQMYNGVIVLNKYNIAQKIYYFLTDIKKINKMQFGEIQNANELESCRSKLSISQRSTNDNYKLSVHFESKLNEHLLSYCSTPKGLLYVNKSNALTECVSRLLGKHVAKSSNVSKFERFGNGILCNQLFSTSPGVDAVKKAGYITHLLNKTFFHLEGSTNDSMKTKLTEIPEDLDDRGTKKLFMLITNLLSSYSGFIKLFSNHTQVLSSTEIEKLHGNKKLAKLSNFNEFINYLLLLDCEVKFKLLSHANQSHLFALNILSLIVTSLDISIFLQSNYHFQDVFLTLQSECLHDDNTYIIEPCSIKRNEILTQLYLLGGCHERIIPSDNLTEDVDTPYPWPLYSSFPPPDYYYKTIATSSSCKLSPNLSEVLNKDVQPNHALIRLKEIQELFLVEIKEKKIKHGYPFHSLLKQCLKLHLYDKQYYLKQFEQSKGTEVDEKFASLYMKMKLNESDEVAVELLIRYGSHLGLVKSSKDTKKDLKYLLLRSRHWLSEIKNSIMLPGFEWCLALFYMMFIPNEKETTFEFIKTILSSLHSVYLWTSNFYIKDEDRKDVERIHPSYSHMCHWIEDILERELPQIYAAFTLSGCPPAQICQHWLRQCFINYLNWDEIALYLSLTVVMGVDYQIYFCMSILKHIKDEILTHSQRGDLIVFLKKEAILDFSSSNYVQYMAELHKLYHEEVMLDLTNF